MNARRSWTRWTENKGEEEKQMSLVKGKQTEMWAHFCFSFLFFRDKSPTFILQMRSDIWSQDVWSNRYYLVVINMGFPQMVKNPPAMQETWVQSLGWEDPLEEGRATHSSIRAWIFLILQWANNYGGVTIAESLYFFYLFLFLIKQFFIGVYLLVLC